MNSFFDLSPIISAYLKFMSKSVHVISSDSANGHKSAIREASYNLGVSWLAAIAAGETCHWNAVPTELTRLLGYRSRLSYDWLALQSFLIILIFGGHCPCFVGTSHRLGDFCSTLFHYLDTQVAIHADFHDAFMLHFWFLVWIHFWPSLMAFYDAFMVDLATESWGFNSQKGPT